MDRCKAQALGAVVAVGFGLFVVATDGAVLLLVPKIMEHAAVELFVYFLILDLSKGQHSNAAFRTKPYSRRNIKDPCGCSRYICPNNAGI